MPEPQKSPEQKLEELKKLLEESDKQLGKLSKQRDALKADVETLSKSVGEIKKTSADFGQGEAGLKATREEFEKYAQTKKHMLDAELGEKTKQIAEIIANVDKWIETKKGEVAALREKAAKAESNQEAAEESLEQKQKSYDDLKNIRKRLSENIQKLKDFKTRIEKFDEETKPASMYALLLELKKVLDNTKIPSQAEYEQQLNAASEALEAAKAEVTNTKAAARTSLEELAKGEESFKVSEKNRLETILKEVDKLNLKAVDAPESKAAEELDSKESDKPDSKKSDEDYK